MGRGEDSEKYEGLISFTPLIRDALFRAQTHHILPYFFQPPVDYTLLVSPCRDRLLAPDWPVVSYSANLHHPIEKQSFLTLDPPGQTFS